MACLMVSVGLVAYDGEDKDMAPPATIYTKVHVQMIRIVRKDFHSRIAQYAAALQCLPKRYDAVVVGLNMDFSM